MHDDLDCSRRHGTKTILAKTNGHTEDNSSSSIDTTAHHHHALHHDAPCELDGQLSAMQSAAAKTALVVGRTPVLRHDLVSVAEEEEDEDEESFYRHWIFRRRVGFEAASPPPSRCPPSSSRKEDRSRWISEKEELTRQLHAIRQQRRHFRRAIRPALQAAASEWNYRLVRAELSHDAAESARQSLLTQTTHLEKEYSTSQRWHVLSDVFFIWHSGPFATIHGTRMGRSARTPLASSKGNAVDREETETKSSTHSHKTSFFSWGETHSHSAVPTRVSPPLVVVPWIEINAALGQIVFLLYTVQRIPHGGVEFRKHVLQPCGSVSKIGFGRSNVPTTVAASHSGERRRILASAHPPSHGDVTWYNLYHYEENGSYLSLGYYARRNFNVALEGLIYCIAEACRVVEQRDRALAVPYVIRVGGLAVGKDSGESCSSEGVAAATVGGLGVAYDPEEGERWTVVWRYLLTDLKWVIAYFAKHVDR